ncbi:type II secretion system protein GspG [Marinicella rhabdoformis]|uniref:type II secretion system protein GspG n=1 Tax=Marinicella rhabdoformis TaxID=2580566 RepID=UPI002484371E|nr:type II secretion system protein GspG [Marinicella rhabdoformis]
MEIGVVFIILLIIFLVTLNNISSHGIFSDQKPRFKITKIMLSKLDWSIKEYRQDTGAYPYALSQLVSSNSDSWMGPYIKEKELKDPWGQPYKYLFMGKSIGYFLFSLGEDNAIGGNKSNHDLTSEASLPLLRLGY